MNNNVEINDFIGFLKSSSFQGDIQDSIGQRLLAASDNSIYHRIPDLVIFPMNRKDWDILSQSILNKISPKTSWTVRGGFTGTNGQSLNAGIIIDCSKYLKNVTISDSEIWVEPGVVLDQLNINLKPLGVFFAPHVSTSSRATIGGMFGTDAAGKGSRKFGRTHHHISAVHWLCPDGEIRHLSTTPWSDILEISKENSWWGRIHQSILDHIVAPRDQILKVQPNHPRGLSGFNLFEAWDDQLEEFNWIAFLSGSEGALGLGVSFKIKTTTIIVQKYLSLIPLKNLDEMVATIPKLLSQDPLAVELIDANILEASKELWSQNIRVTSGDFYNLLHQSEFLFLQETIEAPQIDSIHKVVEDPTEQALWWKIRSQGVELLSRSRTPKKAVAFAEDSVVPPESFGLYIRDLKSLLDSHGLRYSLFGHADVGCVHMRPFMNMQDSNEVELLHHLQDDIFELVHSYGGSFWGEHGRGLRTQFVAKTFGDVVFPLIQQIKRTWDPTGKWNPHKILPSSESFDIEQQLYQSISPKLQEKWHGIIHCNGNGACHNQSPNSLMCPSYLVSTDKFLSPKGRALMAREWLTNPSTELTKDLRKSLDLCLMCEACDHECPSEVNIPEFINHFEETLHQRSMNPFKKVSQWFNTHIEKILFIFHYIPLLLVFHSKERFLAVRKMKGLINESQSDLSHKKSNNLLVLVDLYSLIVNPSSLIKINDISQQLGVKLRFTKPLPSGKLLYKKGLNQALLTEVQSVINHIKSYDATSIIAMEPSFYQAYSHSYPRHFEKLGQSVNFPELNDLTTALLNIISMSENPVSHTPGSPRSLSHPFLPPKKIALFLHCHEHKRANKIKERWINIFNHWKIEVQFPATSCCGMAGIWGYLPKSKDMSHKIFKTSWGPAIEKEGQSYCYTSGVSCLSQTKAHDKKIDHPLELIHFLLKTR